MKIELWTSPTGRRRVLTRLDDAENAAYARAARLAVPRSPSGPRSYGSARGPSRPARSFAAERRAWRADVAAAAGAPALAVGDVADCYPSIRERAIHLAASRTGGDPARVLDQLRAFWDAGVAGLPIGPIASSYLADAALAIADEAAGREGATIIRWVDDVLFAGTRGDVTRATARWVATLHELGLSENESKRRKFDLDELRAWTGLSACACAASEHRRGIIRRS